MGRAACFWPTARKAAQEFSAVDIVAAITDSPNPRKYWSVLKTRLKKEGNKKAAEISLSDQILLFIVQREAIVDITGTFQVQR